MGTLATVFPAWLKTGFAVHRFTETVDEFGAPVKEWSAAPVWEGSGVLRQMSGDMQFLASFHGYQASHRLYLDPITESDADPPVEITTDIQVGDRVYYDNQVYDVKAVNNVQLMDDLLQVDVLWRVNDGTDSAATS